MFREQGYITIKFNFSRFEQVDMKIPYLWFIGCNKHLFTLIYNATVVCSECTVGTLYQKGVAQYGFCNYDTPVFQTDGVRFSSKEEQAMRA